jgi:hypothetical protein
MIFHDLVACYMENYNNHNLRLRMDCKLKGEDNGKSTTILNMDSFTLEVSFQAVLSSDSGGCYFHPSQQIYQPLDGNRQGKTHENKNAVEETKYNCCFTHVLEDPFAVWLETMISPNIFEILRFKFIHNFPDGLSVNKFWSKHVQNKQEVDKTLAWMHWNFGFI